MRVPWYLMAKGKGGSGYKTASGPIVSVNDALAAPLRSLLVNIDPVQDLHGYDSPWPAGGGKNLWDEEWIVEGTAIASKNRIPCEAGQWYYINVSPANGWRFYDAENNIIETVYTNYKQAPTGAVTMWFKLGSAYGTTYKNDVIVAKTTGSGVSVPYSPYYNLCPISGWSAVNVWVKPTYDPTANPTATIQLGDTFYGATLDVTNGVLTVDRAMAVNSQKATKYENEKGYYWYTTANDLGVSGIKNLNAKLVSNRTKSIDNVTASSEEGVISWYANNIIRWKEQGSLTLPEYKAYLTSNPLQICYELATPIIIPLTATEISTLQGQQNNLWADSGDVTIEYLASGGANADLMKLAVAFMGRK